MAKRKKETTAEPVPAEQAESVMQAEGAAHYRDVQKLDTGAKKPTANAEPKRVEFPMDGRINEYGFFRFSKALLETLGWPVSTKENRVEVPLKIEKNPDGSITVRKA